MVFLLLLVWWVWDQRLKQRSHESPGFLEGGYAGVARIHVADEYGGEEEDRVEPEALYASEKIRVWTAEVRAMELVKPKHAAVEAVAVLVAGCSPEELEYWRRHRVGRADEEEGSWIVRLDFSPQSAALLSVSKSIANVGLLKGTIAQVIPVGQQPTHERASSHRAGHCSRRVQRTCTQALMQQTCGTHLNV